MTMKVISLLVESRCMLLFYVVIKYLRYQLIRRDGTWGSQWLLPSAKGGGSIPQWDLVTEQTVYLIVARTQ